MADACPRCGLWFERAEGHWIGAVGMNTVVTFGLLLVGVLLGLLITWPDIPAAGLALGLSALAVVFPIFFYPASKTLWTAVDIAMRPLTDADFPPRAKPQSAGSGGNG